MRVVNSQIVLITEDVRIRNMKIITLIIQVILEALSILALTWLQMQRHNVSNVFQMHFLDVLFRIPEKYQCNLGSIRQNTFFNKSWDGPNSDEPYLSPCNNNAEKITCWTHRSVESTLMHSVLLIIAGLTVFFALCELVYNVWYLSRKPARKLTRKVSTKIDVLFNRNSSMSRKKSERAVAENYVQEEIRASNYNLTRGVIDNYEC